MLIIVSVLTFILSGGFSSVYYIHQDKLKNQQEKEKNVMGPSMYQWYTTIEDNTIMCTWMQNF